MMCQRIGRPPISIIGLGLRWDSSLMRVPRPPARMTAFIDLRGFFRPRFFYREPLLASSPVPREGYGARDVVKRALSSVRLISQGLAQFNMPQHQGTGASVSCSVSSDDKGASEIGRQARREAVTVARATVRPANKAWRPSSPRTIQRICGTGH